MSASNFKKNFSNKLLERLEIEMRKKVERQRGQLLIIPGPDQLKKAVIDTFGSDVEITPSQYSSAIEKGREEAEKQAKRFKAANRLRYVAVVGKLPDLGLPNSYVLGKNMFIVSSFSYSIGQVKAKMLKHFTDNKILTDDQKKTLSRNIHKGHGVKGSAVSQVQIASAISAIPLDNKTELSMAFSAFAKKGNLPKDIRIEVEKLFTNHEQIVTKEGKLVDNYVSNVVFQVGKENIGKDAAFEKAVKKAFRDFATDYKDNLIDEKGSSTLKQKITRNILENLGTGKNIKVKSKDIKASRKTKHTTTTKGNKQKVASAKVVAGGAIKKVAKNRKTQAKTKDTGFSQVKLYAALNMKINSVVAKNMGDPALNFQTGRFASSVKITDVNTTAQGFPSVGYTYQLYPYQTFEPGFQQGDPNRDPRKLIDRSIREIAAQMVTGRLYTRRQ